MPQWRKLHVKITESMDVNDMPDDFTRLFWVLLPTQLCSQGRGVDNPSWARSRVFPLREDVTLKMVADAMDWFAQRGMIVRYEAEGRRYFYVPTFRHYQGNTEKEAASEYPEPTEEGATYSRPTLELVQSKSASDVDVDVDTDTEGMAQSAPAATPPTTPEPQPEPVVEKKTNVRSDPRSKTPAIQCVYAICDKRYPPKALFDTIIATLGDKPDGPKLRRCRQEWIERGYNIASWKWLTEWYVTGIPPKNGAKPPGYGRGKGSAVIETDLDVWRADARAVAAGRG